MMPVHKIKKVLIANRSEVALRVQATCHMMGIQTVAIFSPEDATSSYVYTATEATALSGSGYSAYLNQEEVIACAQKTGADAIHPGYGFLSENASFAQKVIAAGLQWIGPSPSSMTCMADKIGARMLMEKSDVPVVPGFVIQDFSDQGVAQSQQQADALGYPLIIKDPRGGGGKGMQRVACAADFKSSVQAVARQAAKLTGSATLLVEKYIEQGRHIEVQVAGDGKQFVHLFERECSIQRRHQKIIEETPCNFVPTPLLEKMYAAALQAARAVSYNSIGTVEFMVTPDNNFYFLEMNTRLQVEHGVTELTTGVDLVAIQLHIAEHNALPLTQTDIKRQGHAMQCRIYAEDPSHNFIPSTGVLSYVAMPTLPFVRLEHDLEAGKEITPFFDPMIAKILAYGIDRNQAIERMMLVLQNSSFVGITTNKDFLLAIIKSSFFRTGQIHTQLLSDKTILQDLINQSSTKACSEENILAGLAVFIAQLQEATPTLTSHKQNESRRWKDQQWR